MNFDSDVRETVMENMINILIASKMSTFKCKDLLELSASQPLPNNVFKPNMPSFFLQKVTREITKIIELQSRGKKIDLKVSFVSEALKHAKFVGDYQKLQQVLLNLLSNAVKFSPMSGKIDVQISYQILTNSDTIQVYYNDPV